METKKEVETEVETQTEEPSAKARAWRQRFYGQLLARSLSQSRSPSLLGSNLGSGIHLSCSFVVFAMIINQFFHIIWLELNSLFESFKKTSDCCCCSCRLSVYLSDRQFVCLSFFTLINSTKVSGPSIVNSFPIAAVVAAAAVKGSAHYLHVYVY